MAKRINSSNDLKFVIVEGKELTKEDLDAIAKICAEMIYDQIMKEQEVNSGQNSNENRDQSTTSPQNQ